MFGPNFSLDTLLQTIIDVQPTTVAMGAHHYVQLAESDLLESADETQLSSVKMIVPSGSAVPVSCEEVYRRKFPNLQIIIEGYGQTETGICSAGPSNKGLGMVFPHYKIKIEDLETGKRCGPNKTGEICIKGPFSMLRYLKRPKETEDYFDFEGFGHTGDLGFYDDTGDIFFVDRLKELIKYKNNHVSPTELESVLQKHEAVQECLVFGRKEPRVQELITAVVVKKPNFEVCFEFRLPFPLNLKLRLIAECDRD